MIGVQGADTDSQMQFVRETCQEHRPRIQSENLWDRFCREAGEVGFGRVEADFLFCFISEKRPRRIVQIGCGASTAIMIGAAAEVAYVPQITCIEPYPSPYLQRQHADGRIGLVPEPAQRVDLSRLTDLSAGDLLFVDSTHTVKPGSEVNRIILEVLPRLSAGVYVHFHDIYFPYDYPNDLFESLFFWSESTLLHAFLINNSRYAIRASLSMLHYDRPAELADALPGYRPAQHRHGLGNVVEGEFPASTYLQVLAT